MEQLRAKKGFIIDMDGVIYHGNRLLPGAKEFVEWLEFVRKRNSFSSRYSEFKKSKLEGFLSKED